MEYNNIKSELKAMIVETLHLDIEPEDIDDTQSFELGLDLDSLAVITFIVAIEKKFDIIIDDEDIKLDLFDNVVTMTDYVYNKLCVENNDCKSK